MRHWHVLLALLLAIAPSGARAQQPAPPAPLVDPCPVAADPRWTEQEIFVWERVCVGDFANFNTAPGYGGTLDPKKPDRWPQNRVLRPDFLKTILLNERYRRALTWHGVGIVGARFTETIDLEDAELQHRFGLFSSLLEKGAALSRLRSQHPVTFMGSRVAGKLNMNGLHLDASLIMRGGAEFDEVELTNAHVGGQLQLVGSKVTGKLNMNTVRVDGHLLMRDKGEFAEVDLAGARISGDIELTGSKVTGDVNCYGLVTERQIFLNRATFDGRIDCGTARVRGSLFLDDSQFSQNVDFSGADIGGVLSLGQARWSTGAALILRASRTAAIPDLARGWPPRLDVVGFTYLRTASVDGFESWFRRLDRYAPQPYHQLASVVESQGKRPLATAIRYSGRERERAEAKGGQWVWLTALKWIIGYGYYPYFAIYWAIGLVIVGAVVLRISGEGPRNGMPYGLAYSFDILLPIVRLRDRHHQIDLKSWARYYFYCHRIMGYVLASFLVAGLSGLTK